MPTPRERRHASPERVRQNRIAQVMQHVLRALDGHGDVLIIEFHRDDEMHVSVKTLERTHGAPA